MTEFLMRFLVGGAVVSAFSLCGDVLRPKSFAGLWGAAPSVALASIGMTVKQHGAAYVAVESRSMAVGAIAFLCYAYATGQLLKRFHVKALTVAILAMPIWFAVSFGGLWLLMRFV
jgi:hypothetical protein